MGESGRAKLGGGGGGVGGSWGNAGGVVGSEANNILREELLCTV